MPHYPKPFFKKSHNQWYVEIDRRQICLGPNQDATFRQYHQLMQAPPKPQASQNPLVVELSDSFLDWVQKERAPDTFEWYRYRLQRFCERYPALKTTDLRPFHVQQWVDSYPALSRSSHGNYVCTVKACLGWAIQQGYVDKNPIAHMPVPSAEHREVTISQDEYQRVLDLAPDSAFRDLLIVTWETGCRPQESLRVEARHIDHKASDALSPERAMHHSPRSRPQGAHPGKRSRGIENPERVPLDRNSEPALKLVNLTKTCRVCASILTCCRRGTNESQRLTRRFLTKWLIAYRKRSNLPSLLGRHCVKLSKNT